MAGISFINVHYCYAYLLDQIPVGLLLYSHIPTAIIAVLFGGFVATQARKLSGVTLFIVCLAFAGWCAADLASWFAFLGSGLTMFTWTLVDLFAVVFFFFAYYFLYTFLAERDLPMWQKIASVVILAPAFIYTFLGTNLTGYDANTCEALESQWIVLYPYVVEAVYLIAVVVFAIARYLKSRSTVERRKAILASTGVFLFLLFFFVATLAVNLLVNYDSAEEFAYNFGIYGLFGMPVLLGYLSYLIVRYHAFDLKIFGAQALILALAVLLAAEVVFTTSVVNQILIAITLFITAVLGIILIRSVRREIEQREHIEKLAKDLAVANDRLKELDQLKNEFLSVASHQLRAPIAAIRGYAANILDGSYGAVPAPLTQPLGVIQESSRLMVNSIEDYLNISRIEQGRMKYEKSDFDFGKLAEEVTSELQPVAGAKKIALSYHGADGVMVNADVGKVKQVITNLIDNAIKYTEQGSVAVSIEKKDGKAVFMTKDTGIGIAPEEIDKLFSKFTRARDANKVNTTGTGLGLYVAKQLTEGNGGTVRVESDGLGKGSRFIVELPAKA
ncbi:MAG TPA: HAMP domain-containing sensor histidine kinase [Candidatus Paceibacterota bacterium]